MRKEKGKVKFYNSEKGYGFIEVKGKNDVHFSRDSFRGEIPTDGDFVEFEVVEEHQGLHAKNMRIIQKTNASAKPKDNNYYLPKDTLKIITPGRVDNYLLRLNKVAYFKQNKFKFFNKGRKNIELDVQPDYSNIDYQALAERQRNSIKNQGRKTNEITMKTTWRMVIGLGNESVYETSMTLHHVYGIPYIPGSAIKGVTRNYIIKEVFGEKDGKLDLKDAEKRALKNQAFCDIFGCPKESHYKKAMKGKIAFYDSLPITEPIIRPDVMNPHYLDYYSDSEGRTPPADYHNPIPIFFLTVKETEFQFIVGIKEQENKNLKLGEFEGKLLVVVFQWMKKALQEHGVGAKTAVGYGYMTT